MSGTVSPGQAPGRRAGAVITPDEAGRAHRAGRRRWIAAGVVILLVAAGLVAAGVSGAFSGSGNAAASNPYPTSTATVTQQSLSSQTEVDATLGYAGSYTVTGQGQGTITWLPAAGQVIGEGGVLFRTDNAVPVFLLYGTVPAWRALSEGLTGQDVAQLNRDLVRMGYATAAEMGPVSGWDYFSAETAYALELLQTHLGLPVTGSLPVGQAVFEPAALRVATVSASLGSPAGGPVFTATTTTPVVTVGLSADQQTEVKAGDQVTITLPDGSTTPGRVTSVGSVASGSGSSATVPVLVALSDPRAAGGLDQAPVEVAITTGSVSKALVVPVDALLARPSGGYAVEVTGSGGHHLVPVTPGLFDDAAGLVQVTGPGLAAGQRVVVPAI
ncbi:MAG TPA: peptidoglycan-binding protein [Actinobacteria bacterium]|nr:peptidoglycan-binding protein [Actinomycetota bacterium]